jgi:hypothetical protein
MQLAVSRVHLCDARGTRGPNLMTCNFIDQEPVRKRDYTMEFREIPRILGSVNEPATGRRFIPVSFCHPAACCERLC